MVFERCEERAEGSVLWISNFQEYQQFGISKPLSFTSTILKKCVRRRATLAFI